MYPKRQGIVELVLKKQQLTKVSIKGYSAVGNVQKRSDPV